MSEYSPKNILHLLQRRQLGLPLKEKGRAVRHNCNNHRCDYELLKTLLCDQHLQLEVIACRKVSRRDQPSFCHNRLFTNRYRSWFNLCTSPTAGPSLLKSDIFSLEESTSEQSYPNDRPKIIDAVTLDPPNGCVPLPNSQHLPCILLLSKAGWLFQYNLEDASFLGKAFIKSSWFSDELYELNSSETHPRRSLYEQDVSALAFNYLYLTINGEEGRVLVRSGAEVRGNNTYVAYAVFGLFPLRFLCHFVTKTGGNNFKAELWNDLFVLTAKTGSTVSLYGFKDIEAYHHIDSCRISLGSSMRCSAGVVEIGRQPVGVPYTLKVIDLDRSKDWAGFQLFKTKAPKHIFRVGGVPFHYAVAIDKNVTSWSLRSLADGKEVSKFHVDEKADNSHIAGFDFHEDDSGRILLVNKDTVSVFKIEHAQRRARSISGPSCSTSTLSTTPSKRDPVKIISTSPISETDFQLRVIGSVHSVTRRKPTDSKPKVIKCFEIKVDSKYERPISKARSTNNRDETDVINWHYPSESQAGRSSYGRTLRRTQHYTPDRPEFGVRSVSYENELEILAILHLKVNPESGPGYGIGEPHYDLAVSLYDNITGAKLNSVVIERDLPTSEISDAEIVMDEDTIIYTRTEARSFTQELLNYKIMRFCRKY